MSTRQKTNQRKGNGFFLVRAALIFSFMSGTYLRLRTRSTGRKAGLEYREGPCPEGQAWNNGWCRALVGRSRIRLILRYGLFPLLAALGLSALGQNLTVKDYLELPRPSADHRIAYGSDPLQFGDLRLPPAPGPHPVAIVIHGGCWRAQYDLEPLSSFCAALTGAGVATWSLEYRRVGNPGGGWPGTFEDVARGADHLRSLAKEYPLDLSRVVAVGHSAGGHLVLWLAARHRLPKESHLFRPDPLRLTGVVSIAGVPDLRAALERGICRDVIDRVMGGNHALTSPIELLPLGIPQRLINGARDPVVPVELGRSYEAAARKSGDDVRLVVLEEASHFEMVSPRTEAWTVVKQNILSLLTIDEAAR